MKNIDSFKTAQQISAQFTHQGQEYRVKISSPDLRSAASSCWGDWGPMYTFRLQNRERISFYYSSRKHDRLFETASYPSSLCLNSPMLASLRERSPFCLELHDEESGVKYCVYLSPEATVSHVDVQLTSVHRFAEKLSAASRAVTQLSA